MTTPPAPHNNTPDPAHGATTPPVARRGLPGWAWAAIGGLIVIAVVIAGVMITGSQHSTPTPTATSDTCPIPASTPTTVSATSGVTQTGDWSVEVLEYKPDVTEYLTTYDPPVDITIEGHRYLGIKLRVTNTGNEQADPYVDVGVRLDGIESGGPALQPYYFEVGTRYRGDDYLLKLPLLEPGESGEGWLFYQVRGDFELTTIEMQDTRDPRNETPWTEVPFPHPTTSTPTSTP